MSQPNKPEQRDDELREALEELKTHYERVCLVCGHTWLGLHCPHDGFQNPCTACELKPEQVKQTTNDTCEGTIEIDEIMQLIQTNRQQLLAELEREINLYYKRELGQVVEKQFLQGWSQALFVVTALLNKAKGEK